jgi:hypothetical protein
MCFSSPSVPAPLPAPTPAPALPDQGVQNAGSNQRNLAAQAYGVGNTIVTGPAGLVTPASTTSNKGQLGG